MLVHLNEYTFTAQVLPEKITGSILSYLDCPANTWLAYNGNESVCMDLMPSTSCALHEANCDAIYGPASTLLQITTYGMLKDALYAMDE